MDFSFDLDNLFWFRGNALLTCIANALSVEFPEGERSFIRSVRHYEQRLSDRQLREQVRAFIDQEAQHGKSHTQLNRQLLETSAGLREVQRINDAGIKQADANQTPAQRLARTVALEHITAIMAAWLLNNPHKLDGIPDGVRAIFLWHALEELEHKSVAFDVYQTAVGDDRLRRVTAALVVAVFVARNAQYVVMQLRELRHRPTLRELAETAAFLFGRDGLVSSTARPFLDFFRNGFHPWRDHDNRDLVDGWEQRFPEVAELQQLPRERAIA